MAFNNLHFKWKFNKTWKKTRVQFNEYGNKSLDFNYLTCTNYCQYQCNQSNKIFFFPQQEQIFTNQSTVFISIYEAKRVKEIRQLSPQERAEKMNSFFIKSIPNWKMMLGKLFSFNFHSVDSSEIFFFSTELFCELFGSFTVELMTLNILRTFFEEIFFFL